MDTASKPSLFVEKKRLEALLKNKQTTVQWEERKKAHEEVRKCLETYAGKLQERIMVPVGKRALIRGRLVNTNQVFVSLGAGWFVKVCSTEAQKMCSRRILECDNMLANLDREKKLFEGWTAISDKQIFETDDAKEIVEPYDEKEEKKWRKTHEEKVKDYKKKLADVRQDVVKSREKEKDSEELWKHLDLLEEEFEDELNRLDKEDNSTESSDEDTSQPLDSDDDSNEEDGENDKGNICSKPLIEEIVTENESQPIDIKIADNAVPSTVVSIVKNTKTKEERPTKKVTFDDDFPSVNEDENLPVVQMQTIQLGEIVERSVDLSKHIQSSDKPRPASKFKIAKQANKK